jgi:hypothetical protein
VPAASAAADPSPTAHSAARPGSAATDQTALVVMMKHALRPANISGAPSFEI